MLFLLDSVWTPSRTSFLGLASFLGLDSIPQLEESVGARVPVQGTRWYRGARRHTDFGWMEKLTMIGTTVVRAGRALKNTFLDYEKAKDEIERNPMKVLPLLLSPSPASFMRLFMKGGGTPSDVRNAISENVDLGQLQNLFPVAQNPAGWIKSHNYALDQGLKFMIHSKSPLLNWTDLFDLTRWGCFTDSYRFKYWWHHPQIRFGVPLHMIKVTLTDNNTGYMKWDAIYDLGGRPFLRFDEEPQGGTRPFFAPDWCPGHKGQTAKSYTLEVHNLSSSPHSTLDFVGRMNFAQYNLPLLQANYDPYERDLDEFALLPRGREANSLL